jgi:hypothetical protein
MFVNGALIQIVWAVVPVADVREIVALGLTTMVFEAVVLHDPPVVVNVNVMGVAEFAAAVKVAVAGVLPALLAKVPLGADQIAPVAPPP